MTTFATIKSEYMSHKAGFVNIIVADLAAAQAFADDRGGTVMALNDIPDSAVSAPASAAVTGDEDYTRRLKALAEEPEG